MRALAERFFARFCGERKANNCRNDNDGHADEGGGAGNFPEEQAVNQAGKDNAGEGEDGSKKSVSLAPTARAGKLRAS